MSGVLVRVSLIFSGENNGIQVSADFEYMQIVTSHADVARGVTTRGLKMRRN